LGFFASVDVRPAPYGGPSCPAPTRGAGAEFCARPLMGGRTTPPPRGGLGRHLLGLGLGLALGLGVGVIGEGRVHSGAGDQHHALRWDLGANGE
jgi:hypothetical protein